MATKKMQKGGASDPIKAMYKAKGEKMPTTKETLKYVKKNGSGYLPPAGKKMKTGGMVNPNAKMQAQKAAGSKGVKSGVNPKAVAAKKATGKSSGGVDTPPKTAIPKAQKGWSVTDPAKEGRMGSGKVATKTSPTLSGGTKTKTISYGAIYPGAKGSITKTKRNAQGTVVKETRKNISQDRASRMINRRSK